MLSRLAAKVTRATSLVAHGRSPCPSDARASSAGCSTRTSTRPPPQGPAAAAARSPGLPHSTASAPLSRIAADAVGAQPSRELRLLERVHARPRRNSGRRRAARRRRSRSCAASRRGSSTTPCACRRWQGSKTARRQRRRREARRRGSACDGLGQVDDALGGALAQRRSAARGGRDDQRVGRERPRARHRACARPARARRCAGAARRSSPARVRRRRRSRRPRAASTAACCAGAKACCITQPRSTAARGAPGRRRSQATARGRSVARPIAPSGRARGRERAPGPHEGADEAWMADRGERRVDGARARDRTAAAGELEDLAVAHVRGAGGLAGAAAEAAVEVRPHVRELELVRLQRRDELDPASWRLALLARQLERRAGGKAEAARDAARRSVRRGGAARRGSRSSPLMARSPPAPAPRARRTARARAARGASWRGRRVGDEGQPASGVVRPGRVQRRQRPARVAAGEAQRPGGSASQRATQARGRSRSSSAPAAAAAAARSRSRGRPRRRRVVGDRDQVGGEHEDRGRSGGQRAQRSASANASPPRNSGVEAPGQPRGQAQRHLRELDLAEPGAAYVIARDVLDGLAAETQAVRCDRQHARPQRPVASLARAAVAACAELGDRERSRAHRPAATARPSRRPPARRRASPRPSR